MAGAPERTRVRGVAAGLFFKRNFRKIDDVPRDIVARRRACLNFSEIFFGKLYSIMSVLLNSTGESQSKSKRALLAERLRKAAGSTSPLSFAQQRLWFIDQLEPNSPLYNVPTMARLSGVLNLEALQRALDAIMLRHESLRTRFVDAEGSPTQLVDRTLRLSLDLLDLTSHP